MVVGVSAGLNLPREFQRRSPAQPKVPAPPEAVAALEGFATEMLVELGDTPQLYQLNRARLALADRHELLRRATPVRSRGQLDEIFNRCYAKLFERFLALQRPDLSSPAPPPVAPPEPPARRRTVAEAMAAALDDLT